MCEWERWDRWRSDQRTTKVTFGVRDNSRKTERGHGNTSKIPMGNLTSSDNSKKYPFHQNDTSANCWCQLLDSLVSSLQMRQATADVSCWIGLVGSLQMRRATAYVSWWIGLVGSLQMVQATADVSWWIGLVSSLQMRHRFSEFFANDTLTTGQVTHGYFDVVLPWHLSVFLLLSTTHKQDKWKLCVLFANSKCLPRVTEERRK